MSNTDKRSIKTDALETLGSIIDNTAGRDAIHLAVEPIIAGQDLNPGQDIGIRDGLAFKYMEDEKTPVKLVGIVDPFLKYTVRRGQMFWLIVYPRTISSLRHVWTHPDFEEHPYTIIESNQKSKEVSEKWVRKFLRDNDAPSSYQKMIDLIKSGGVDDEEYFFVGDLDGHCAIPSEFWDHIEIITGKKMNIRPGYFSCSC
jgi:hypothetical protein